MKRWRLDDYGTLAEIGYLAALPADWIDPDERAREVPFDRLFDDHVEGLVLSAQAIAQAVVAALAEAGADPTEVLRRIDAGDSLERALHDLRIREMPKGV